MFRWTSKATRWSATAKFNHWSISCWPKNRHPNNTHSLFAMSPNTSPEWPFKMSKTDSLLAPTSRNLTSKNSITNTRNSPTSDSEISSCKCSFYWFSIFFSPHFPANKGKAGKLIFTLPYCSVLFSSDAARGVRCTFSGSSHPSQRILLTFIYIFAMARTKFYWRRISLMTPASATFRARCWRALISSRESTFAFWRRIALASF